MMMLKTIKEASQESVKIQRSEFISFLYPISDVNSLKDILAAHNVKYKDATHNCYAYVLGKKQEIQYYSDQGEPSGTAGKPILNTLLRHNLTNVLAIVTRYYGGVKLGVRGLIDAYSEATELAVSSTSLVEYRPTLIVEVTCEYSSIDQVKHSLQPLDSELSISEYSDKVKGRIIYPEDRQPEIDNLITDLTQKRLLTINQQEEQ